MKLTRKWLLLSGLLVIVVGGGGWATLRSGQGEVAYTTEPAKRQDLQESVTANGEIQARTKVNIGSTVTAEIMDIHVKDGQLVKTGDLLVSLDQVRLRQDEVRADLTLASARQDLKNAQFAHDKQARTFKGREELFGKGIVSSEDYHQEKLNLENASTLLERAKVGVKQAEAALAQAKDALAKTVIRSPMAGQVTGLKAEKGETAIAGQTNLAGAVLMVVSDLSEMMAEIKVGELDVVKLRVDQPAEISVDAIPGKIFQGKVITVASGTDRPAGSNPTSQETQSYKVRIQLSGSAQELAALRPGMSARIAVLTAERKGIVAIPLAAIQEREAKAGGLGLMSGSRSIVFVVADGKARERTVHLGLSTRRAAEALDGVKDGEPVITGPTKSLSGLSDGMAVTLAKPKPKGKP
jgi:HlyD family secretion protein